ncbi:MAG TPA: histidine phosphatase family protein [Vicinamibacterales bacterium]|nr:histidine phosphatase family protein [Vicinamibacterales bacterium]
MQRPSLLVLVRHGQSQRNVVKKRNRFYLDDESRQSVKGIPDHLIALTAEGHRQAVETGRALRETFGPFDHVVHSGYTRTIETTEGLLAAYTDAERQAMTVRHHLFIRERDAGHAYDMTDAEASAAFPWLQDYWNTFGPFFARPPGGESLAQVCERVYAFLQRLARLMAGRRVLVVSHAGTLWCFRYVLERWTYDEAEHRFNTEPMPNCAVTSYRYDPTAQRLVLGDASRVYWAAPGPAGEDTRADV